MAESQKTDFGKGNNSAAQNVSITLETFSAKTWPRDQEYEVNAGLSALASVYKQHLRKLSSSVSYTNST